MAKHEPPREDGLKGYVVCIWRMGRDEHREVYAKNSSDARYEAVGRPGQVGIYAKGVRRKLDGEVVS